MVTTLVYNPGIVAGMVLSWTNADTSTGKKGSGVINRGDLLVPDVSLTPDGWKLAPLGVSDVTGPFAVAYKAALTGDTEVRIIQGGMVAMTAGGTIEIGKKVSADSGTQGRVMQWAATTVSATPTQTQVTSVGYDEGRVVGVCMGLVDTMGSVTPLAPVVGDLAAILLRKT